MRTRRPCASAPTQIGAFNKLYQGPPNPSTGQRIYAGWSAGSELGWRGVIGGPNVFPTAEQFFRNMVFRDASWDWRRFDFDKGWTYAIAHFSPLVNADDVDLRAFEQAGGKMLHDHGRASVGPHPDQFDPMDALRSWVEDQQPPERIVVRAPAQPCAPACCAHIRRLPCTPAAVMCLTKRTFLALTCLSVDIKRPQAALCISEAG